MLHNASLQELEAGGDGMARSNQLSIVLPFHSHSNLPWRRRAEWGAEMTRHAGYHGRPFSP
jgi:hypothetical protein